MTPIYAGDLPVLSDFFHLNFLSYLYRVETHERHRVTKLEMASPNPITRPRRGSVKDYCPLERERRNSKPV